MRGVERAIWGKRRPSKKTATVTGNRFANWNAKVRLTEAPKGVKQVPTNDPHDRAHLDFDTLGFLIPAMRGRGPSNPRGRAREYPLSSMTLGGCSIDSVFDATHKRQRDLDRALNGDDDDAR